MENNATATKSPNQLSLMPGMRAGCKLASGKGYLKGTIISTHGELTKLVFDGDALVSPISWASSLERLPDEEQLSEGQRVLIARKPSEEEWNHVEAIWMDKMEACLGTIGTVKNRFNPYKKSVANFSWPASALIPLPSLSIGDTVRIDRIPTDLDRKLMGQNIVATWITEMDILLGQTAIVLDQVGEEVFIKISDGRRCYVASWLLSKVPTQAEEKMTTQVIGKYNFPGTVDLRRIYRENEGVAAFFRILKGSKFGGLYVKKDAISKDALGAFSVGYTILSSNEIPFWRIAGIKKSAALDLMKKLDECLRRPKDTRDWNSVYVLNLPKENTK